MPYQIAWHVPECLIYVRLDGKIFPSEVNEIALTAHDMIASIPHLVHLIIDSSEGGMGGSIREYASLSFKRASNTGWIVILGNDRIGGLLLSIFARIVGVSFVYKNTLEETIEFLAERDFNIKDYVEANLNS
ncbi:MAG: hypothetical protein K8L97_00135 [Anaerolineae bacterium]|nr:hypothetical protein [Anaerolineae bacterium]